MSKLVVVESPYAARHPDGSWDFEGVEENLGYLRICMHDCLLRGEAPYASHGLYTQPGVLDDRIPEERKMGIEAGFAWNEKADETVVYVDRGLSSGMKQGIENAVKAGRPITIRSLDDLKTPMSIATMDEVSTYIYWRHQEKEANQ